MNIENIVDEVVEEWNNCELEYLIESANRMSTGDVVRTLALYKKLVELLEKEGILEETL